MRKKQTAQNQRMLDKRRKQAEAAFTKLLEKFPEIGVALSLSNIALALIAFIIGILGTLGVQFLIRVITG